MATSRMETPKGLRLHFGLFGKRNAGKSSLINELANQNISIVSSVAGTTTDPVEKAFELSPIGPVVFMDTAGIDDVGDLGAARVQKSLSVLEWMDIAIVVCEAKTWGEHEENILRKTKLNGTPTIVVFNKTDLQAPSETQVQDLRARGYKVVQTSAANREGIAELRDAIIATVLEQTEPDRPLMGELAKAGDTVILVTPIDTGAPKGRLILPQVQAIRELLDAGAKCMVIKEDRLKETLESLGKKPRLVITDSQVFGRVSKDTPKELLLTSFSILFARYKGNLETVVEGARTLEKLKDGDKVLISEGCTHHRQCGDIGTVKLPAWIRKYTGKNLEFSFTSGTEFPDELGEYSLIVHCGGCMLNEREMKYRLSCAEDQGVPMTNYGIIIAYMNGILERSLEPFS